MVIKAAGGLIIQDNKALLIKRINVSAYNNMWAIPGGKPENGETEEQNAIRELEEEIGIGVTKLRKICDYTESKDGLLDKQFAGFLIEEYEGTPINREPHKIERIEFFPLNSLPQDLADFTKLYINTYLESLR